MSRLPRLLDAIAAMVREGATMQRIVNELGTSEAYVRVACQRRGLRTPRKYRTYCKYEAGQPRVYNYVHKSVSRTPAGVVYKPICPPSDRVARLLAAGYSRFEVLQVIPEAKV